MEDKKGTWRKALAQIEIKLDSPAQFKTFFKDTRILDVEGKKVTLGAKNSYTADWLNQKHKDLVKDTLSYISGKNLVVQFVYDKDSAPKEEKSSETSAVETPILQVKDGIDDTSFRNLKNSKLNEAYTFASYVVGSTNRLAHAAAVAVSQTPGKTYNPLFLYGHTGVGKTHLAQATAKSILDKDSNMKVLYSTSEDFLNDMVHSIKSNTMDGFRDKYRKLDVLIIDDIQLLSNRKETQTAFFNTFNVLFQASKQIIITSDKSPEEIPNIEQRLISRFQGGMVVDISRPGFEERVAILEKKLQESGDELPNRILQHIAELVKDNIRELEGCLQKIILYNSMKKDGDLSQAEIARILGKDASSKRKQISVNTIISKVAKEFGVTSTEIKGPRRTKDISFSRQVCMFILRTEFDYKLKEVSEHLKRKDHTTAIHAIDKIQSLVATNPTVKEQVESIVQNIQKSE